MRKDCGAIGFPAPATASDFRPGPRGLSLHRPPHLPMRFHPPSSLPPPPECYGLRAALRAWLNLATQPIGRRAPPLGSSPSSRPQPPASTIPQGIPTPRSRSVPDVSHVLDGLLRQLPLRACFIPLPRPGFALQGFVPRVEPYRVSPARSCPPGVGRTRLRPANAPPPPGPCSPPRVRCRPGRIRSRMIRAPRGLPAPPGSLPAQRGNAFTSPPPSTLAAKNPSRLAPGVFPLPGLACLGSGCRPARASWPEPPSLLSKSRVRGPSPAVHRAAGHAKT